MQTSTLRPGLLVSLKTSVTGNVAYRRQDIETEHLTADGAKRARWETERTVVDPAEHDEAIKVRGKCRTLVTAICSASAFGLLCPEEGAAELMQAVEEAQALAADFNRRAKLTRIGVYVIAGKVAADDAQAVRAIASEVRDLLADMETGLRNLDVKTVRDAANKARDIGRMLTPTAQARVQVAIDAARSAARRIVKAGETAALEVDARALRSITESRTAFLEIGDDIGEIAAPVASGRALDMVPSEPSAIAAAPAAMLFELD